jgi:hypothetical protein
MNFRKEPAKPFSFGSKNYRKQRIAIKTTKFVRRIGCLG